MPFSGQYSYNFTRIEPKWNSTEQTGISSVVLGLSCSFDGIDYNEQPVKLSSYIDNTFYLTGESGILTTMTYEEFSGNLTGIIDQYMKENNWYCNLRKKIDSKLTQPKKIENFQFPSELLDSNIQIIPTGS